MCTGAHLNSVCKNNVVLFSILYPIELVMARCQPLTKTPSQIKRGNAPFGSGQFSCTIYGLFSVALEHNGSFESAIQAVLGDAGFKFPSQPAQEALEIAGRLGSWCKDTKNTEAMTTFVGKLFQVFDKCIQCSTRKLTHTKLMEKIWGAYYDECSQQSFRESWMEFLKNSVEHDRDSPIFYNFMTDTLFRSAIKQYFEIEESSQDTGQQADELTYDEKNIVRYVAGALYRAVQDKVRRSCHPTPMKKELLLCLEELLEGYDEEYDDSTDWTKLVDRGGLNHVSNTTFALLSAMEIVVKVYTATHQAATHQAEFNAEAVKSKVMESDEVHLQWESLSTNWGEKESEALLELVIDHYLTVRAHACAKNYMEKYKNRTKTRVQKSQAFRKTLSGSKSDTTVSEDHD